MATHSDVVKMPPALKPNPNLSNKNANARLEIEEAVAKAKKDHQRVILVFGGNWCYDCHVLDQAFHQTDVAPLLENNFQVVHVDVGDDGKKNNDLAAEYQVPLEKGVPALAILDPDGKLLYSQKDGEWESARSLDLEIQFCGQQIAYPISRTDSGHAVGSGTDRGCGNGFVRGGCNTEPMGFGDSIWSGQWRGAAEKEHRSRTFPAPIVPPDPQFLERPWR